MTTVAEAKHNQVLTARQIEKTLQARLGAKLTAIATAHGLTLDAPVTDSYWKAPAKLNASPGQVYALPAVGILWSDSDRIDGAGDLRDRWLIATRYLIAISYRAATPELMVEMGQDYATAVSQVLCGHLRDDAISDSVSSSSIGEAIPVKIVRPVGTAAGVPAWWDASNELMAVGEAIIEVHQYEAVR